jgi:hypothetical protein
MASTPTQSSSVEPVPETDVPVTNANDVSGVSRPMSPGADHPRLIEEHHATGRYGEDELEATDELGRRWYHLRPEPRGRYDVIGFNYTWWLIWIFFIFVIFLPWGHGWGY